MALRKSQLTLFCTLNDIFVPPKTIGTNKPYCYESPTLRFAKNSLAFTAIKSENLRRFLAFRRDIPRNEPLGAPAIFCVLREQIFANLNFRLYNWDSRKSCNIIVFFSLPIYCTNVVSCRL